MGKMGNVSSKLLGVFVQKRLRTLYIPVNRALMEGEGGGGVKRVKQEYRRPQVSQPEMVPLPFVYFCHQSF